MIQLPFFKETIRALILPAAIFALAAGAGVASLSAQEFPAMPPAPKPFDWNGFYIGGNVGAAFTNYNMGGHHTTVDVGQQLSEFQGGPLFKRPDVQNGGSINGGGGPEIIFNDSGDNGGGTGVSPTGGGQMGYQMQFGHFVFGVEGAFNGVAASSDVAKSHGFDSVSFLTRSVSQQGLIGVVSSADTTENSMRQAETHWVGAATGRLGYTTGRFLFYGTGGAAFAGVTTLADDRAHTDFFGFSPDISQQGGQGGLLLGSINNRFKAEDDGVMVGYTAGGGFDVAVTQACSMGVEYRHNGFGNRNFHFASNQGPIFPGNTNVDTDSDQVTFRVNFWLGHLGH